MNRLGHSREVIEPPRLRPHHSMPPPRRRRDDRHPNPGCPPRIGAGTEKDPHPHQQGPPPHPPLG